MSSVGREKEDLYSTRGPQVSVSRWTRLLWSSTKRNWAFTLSTNTISMEQHATVRQSCCVGWGLVARNVCNSSSKVANGPVCRIYFTNTAEGSYC